MEKNIPIDQLFKDQLSNREEQLNLGAWANMERLLDGKNPYSQEDDKKKRRILPLFLLFTLLTGALTASYVSLTKKTNKKDNEIVQLNTKIIQPAPTETISNETPVSTNNNALPSSQKPEAIIISSIKNDSKNNSEINKEQVNEKNVSTTKNIDLRTNSSEKNKQPNVDKSSTEIINDSQNSTNNISSNNKKLNDNLQSKKIDDIKLKEIINNDNKISTLTKLPKQHKTKKIIDTATIIEIAENKIKGSNLTQIDTIGFYKKPIEKIVDIVEEPTISKIEPINPRLVKLSPEEELNASKKIDLPIHTENNSVANKTEAKTAISSKNTKIEKKSSTKEYSNSVFNMMKNVSDKLANKRVAFYPGMSVGVNAVLFNSEHNHGGFHFGVNNLIPINNYFSILSELKLFYKYNGGYSVNDKQTFMYSHSADATTLASQNLTIHQYQIDSTTKKYNFNTFSTLDLPIILQSHIGKFSPYVGVNLSYLFKIKETAISKNIASTYLDTLSNSSPFIEPVSSNFQYTRDDFKSKFGYGYTVGASYNINSSLYVDLRLSNILKDNSTNTASKTISDAVFKVPFMQFSIGYRFRKFNPKN